jgi:general secretion pathway protein C
MRIDARRWNTIVTFALFVALCMSATYWATQLFRPAQRVLAEAAPSDTGVNLEAAAGLFGGRGNRQAAVNYQLKGVVLASDPTQSVAILSENGKPPRAIRSGGEIAQNVRVKEVQQQYVLLSDGGAVTRIDLPAPKSASIASPSSSVPPVTAAAGTTVNAVSGDKD